MPLEKSNEVLPVKSFKRAILTKYKIRLFAHVAVDSECEVSVNDTDCQRLFVQHPAEGGGGDWDITTS